MPRHPAVCRSARAEIPGARRATIEGAAHVPSMERPDEFDRLVLGFLDEAVERRSAGCDRTTRRADLGARPDRLDRLRRGEVARLARRAACACASGSATCSRFADEVGSPGVIDTFVLLGMGGSSLAPIVLKQSFARGLAPGPRHHAPGQRSGTRPRCSTSTGRSFIASSKSGTTLETRSHLDFFWERNGGRGEFVRCDHRSRLRARGPRARARLPRRSSHGEPTIGGRYSALSPFGMVPAALLGLDLEGLFDRTAEMVEACRVAEGNPGLELGQQLGRGLARRPRQGLHRRDPRRLRTLGGAADRGVDRQGRQGLVPAPRRITGGAGPPAQARCDSRIRTSSARSSSAGSSPSPSPARTSRSTPSISRTSRPPRTRRTRYLRAGDVELEPRVFAGGAARPGE